MIFVIKRRTTGQRRVEMLRHLRVEELQHRVRHSDKQVADLLLEEEGDRAGRVVPRVEAVHEEERTLEVLPLPVEAVLAKLARIVVDYKLGCPREHAEEERERDVSPLAMRDHVPGDAKPVLTCDTRTQVS